MILGRTRRDFPAEMLGTSPPVDEPPERPKSHRVRPGGKIYVEVLRRSWLMGLRMTNERYREKHWPEFVEQMEREGGVLL